MALIRWVALLKGWQLAVIKGLFTLLAMCLLLFIGFAWGVMRAETQAALKDVKAQLATEREHAARLAALGRALAEVELRASDAVQRTEQAEHTLRQEIARYAQRPRLAGDSRPCLDADGLRLWRAANAAAHPDTEATGLDAGGGPATVAAQRRGGRDPAAKPRGGHHGLPPPARPSQRAGGVDQGTAP